MKITLKSDASSGKAIVSGGEYMVALSSESGEIVLTGGGKQFKIPAKRRRAQSRSRVTTIAFYSGGGNIWSLVVTTPKHGEWVASLEYLKDNKR